jgi:DNA polymerase (family 10)
MAELNLELARMFDRIADAMELKGETGFRVLSYRRAARMFAEMAEDITELDREDRLMEVPGIGKGIAQKVHEYIATGRMKKYAEAISGLPEELFSLLELQGLGPKTLRLLHTELGVGNLDDLKRVIDDGSAAALPGMGQKKLENLSRAIQLSEMAGDRMYLNEALDLAARVIDRLKVDKTVRRIAFAGSLRRGKETIGDIDILVSSTEPEAVVSRFTGLPDLVQILGSGATKASALFNTPGGIRQVDIRVIPAASWGAALQYFTGSKEHNVALRGLAQRKGLKVSEYGVFRRKRKVAGRTEEEVYRAVGLPFIAPELREDRGEIDAALAGTLPSPVTLGDIRSDLHMHTTVSDGKSSRENMAEACRKRGYSHIAIAEHSVTASYAGGLTPDQLNHHCDWVDKFNGASRGFKILKSAEVDIRTDGRLDYSDRLLERLDLVIASIHQGFRKNATERMCAAIEHPLVHMIAHPTGRIIGKREGYDINLDRVLDAAARCKVVLEINAFYGRLDLNDIWARKASELGIRLAVNTDAHAVEDLDWMQFGILTARRAWLTSKDIVNCLTCRQLMKLLGSIRGKK